jgi:hypothetical protein
VQCSSNGRVERLRFFNIQFSGTIDAAIGQLTRLTELYLHARGTTEPGVGLRGSLPSTMTNLVALSDVEIVDNHVDGPLVLPHTALTYLYVLIFIFIIYCIDDF